MSNILKIAGAGVSAAAEETDANFNQTVLLLHGDGTDGAQNNTFLDSSTNNFTVTRNGNTTQGTFSPFSLPDGRWSYAFDGSGDVLTLDGSAGLTLGTGDFTISFWVYYNSGLGADVALYDSRPTSVNGVYPLLYSNPSGELIFYVSSAARITSDTTLVAGNWYHVALTRSGTDTKLYINGTQEGLTYTDSNNYLLGASRPAIGAAGIGLGADPLNGYMSNVQVVKGTAITPPSGGPTSPVSPSTSNQQLLTCYSNRFVDSNTATTAKTVTVNGNPKVTPFSPFAPTAAYSASVNGGSGYFDGTGDYLSLADDAAFDLGSGAFCLEAWVYPNVGGITAPIFGQWDATEGNQAYLFVIFSGNELALGRRNTSGTYSDISGGTVIAGQWNHCVACRDSSNNISLFINGTRVATQNVAITFRNTAINAFIGSASGDDLNGYISSLRVVKGSEVYSPTSTTLTVPTAPLTAIANTSLLTNFTNAGIFDQTGKNNLETVGNAQIDTTTKKYGTGSIEFDGTGDYLLQTTNLENYTFGTGPFTIEFWLYLNALTPDQMIFDMRPASTQGVYPALFFADSGDTLNYFVSSINRITSGALLTGTWYHIAIARSGTDTKMFLDGTQTGSTYSDSNNYLCSRMLIGAQSFTLGSIPLNGFIDDLRITKGVARYTSAFTPPTKAFPDL
jgi:hypothetical protein